MVPCLQVCPSWTANCRLVLLHRRVLPQVHPLRLQMEQPAVTHSTSSFSFLTVLVLVGIQPTLKSPRVPRTSKTGHKYIHHPCTHLRLVLQVKLGGSRRKVDKKTAHVLDNSGSQIRQIVIRQANELLMDEYEDEYDDSYDDLGVHTGADGQADVEGDDVKEAAQTSNKPYFVKDGKIYNAPKEGAIAVKGLGKAQAAARRRDEEIHGLGAGGNLPPDAATSQTPPPESSSSSRGRDRGRHRGRGRSSNHHRKDRSLKKRGM